MFDIIQRKKWPITKGIYKIWFDNSATGKVYIGSSFSERGFRGRWGTHLGNLRRLKHPSIKLQNAYNKYGESGLRFGIVELVDDANDLIPIEQKYIDDCKAYTHGYNCSPTAGSQYGYKQTKETIDKINKTRWGKFEKLRPDIIDLYQQGYRLREVESKLGLCPHTASKILKQSNIELKSKADYYKIPIHQYTKDGEFIRSWDSAYEASLELNLAESNIRKVLKGNLSSGGYFFSYRDDITKQYIEDLIKDKKEKARKSYKNSMTAERLKNLTEIRLSKDNPHNRILEVEQYDLAGNLLKTWKDTKEIVDFYGLKNATPVLRVLKGERKKFKNSIWKTKNYKKRDYKSVKDQIQTT